MAIAPLESSVRSARQTCWFGAVMHVVVDIVGDASSNTVMFQVSQLPIWIWAGSLQTRFLKVCMLFGVGIFRD